MADVKAGPTNGTIKTEQDDVKQKKKADMNKDTESMAEEAAEAVLDEDEEGMEVSEILENGDGEEENGKDEDGKKKKRPRYFIPSRLEFRQDRIREQQERTVMIGPTTLDDLMYPKLMECIRGSTQFFIRFFKEEPKPPVEEEKPEEDKSEVKKEKPVVKKEKSEEDFKGHIEIRFNSVAEAEACVEALKNVREGLSAKRITYEYTKEDEYKEMRKIGNPQDSEGLTGHRASRMVAITGLDAEVTREMITEKVPDAVEVMIPKSYTSDVAIKGYAYIELPNVQKVKEMENKSIEVEEKSYKVHTLMEIPALESVIRRIDKERVTEAPARAMEQAKKDRLRLLLRYASHYERVEDLPESKVEAVKKRVAQIRKRLRAESRRAGTATRGAARGGRGTGARGGLPRGGGRGRGGPVGWASPRGGYNARGRGYPGYGQRPMSAGYVGGYGYNNGYGYGYEDHYDYGRGDYPRMNQGYGPPQRGGMRGGAMPRRDLASAGYYRANNPRKRQSPTASGRGSKRGRGGMWYD